MRKLILMTSAAVLAPISAIAQTPTCTATPDCASLGYTEASCPNGGVKCPWGDKWFCATSETEICSKYGFKYTCTGTGYAGGAGEACDGKYTACSCASPYIWSNGNCTCSNSYKYTCTGSQQSPSGSACNKKYQSCSCSSNYYWSDGSCIKRCPSPYRWDGTQCSCDKYMYTETCTGEHETGGQGEACNGKYWYCSCESGYRWDCDKCVLGSGPDAPCL